MTLADASTATARATLYRRCKEALVAHWAAATSAGIVLVVGCIPILARPGYELALVAGILLPGLCAVATSLAEHRDQRAPFDSFCNAIKRAIEVVLCGFLAACIHALRSGACDFKEGSMLFFLGPGIGVVLASIWGVFAAELVQGRSRRRAVAFALLFPVSSIGLQLALFYWTPMVFAFDPLVGYFSGALYDTVIDFRQLYSYRAASLASIFAAYVLFLHLERNDAKRWQWRNLRRPGLVLCGLMAFTASALTVMQGPRLGHWQTAGSIAKTLGGYRDAGLCRIVYDERLSAQSVDLFARECRRHSAAIRTWLTMQDPEPVHVYLFRDVQQKRWLMGAAQTSIAKPWRREVYVQARAFPHPVLRHELVHALASSWARGPFGVAGSAGGWLPNPGLIEGLAVAAAPRGGPLSHRDWAAAMAELKILPSLNNLFGLSFFGSNSSVGYTAAGAFVDDLRDHYGNAVLRKWYAGHDLAELTKKSLAQLETDWRQRLKQRHISPAVRAVARARFDRPSLFGRRCPHAVDTYVSIAGQKLAEGATARALAHYQQALELDPHHLGARFGVARCYLRGSKRRRSKAWLEALSQAPDVPTSGRAWAFERQGDLALKNMAGAQSLAPYRSALALRLDENSRRTLLLKMAFATDPLARRALVALLIGEGDTGPSLPLALDLLGRWRQRSPNDPTPHYLLARQHFNRGDYAVARRGFERALALPEKVAGVRTETLRLALISCCALGLRQAATSHWQNYKKRPLTEHQRQTARNMLTLCSDSS